jgi:hypothetical protein
MPVAIMEIETEIYTACPGCQKTGHFVHIGTQTWPEAVARKLNLPTVIQVYRCEHCHTSLTEIQLRQEKF